MTNAEKIKQKVLSLGAFLAETVSVSDIVFNADFRKLCESNSCGKYGRNWMCPPHAGEIQDLIAQARGYSSAVVYQTVGLLEDSFDIEGMLENGRAHNAIAQELDIFIKSIGIDRYLHLGAGGCKNCERCSILDNEPCAYPDKAMSSLETYGIDVSILAKLANMKYINGQNTVTYFGAVFLTE